MLIDDRTPRPSGDDDYDERARRRERRGDRFAFALFLGGLVIGPPLLGTLVAPGAGAALFILTGLLMAFERGPFS